MISRDIELSLYDAGVRSVLNYLTYLIGNLTQEVFLDYRAIKKFENLFCMEQYTSYFWPLYYKLLQQFQTAYKLCFEWIG